jgi:autotransporter-associated beta strand protein
VNCFHIANVSLSSIKNLKMKVLKALVFIALALGSYAQHLTISNSGELGTSGTNWSINGNVLQLAASGSATVHPSVVENHLLNTGDLTISIPKIIGTTRSIIISNSISYSGNTNRTLTFNAPNHIFISSGANITSANAALNVVLRAICLLGSPDNGTIQILNSTINTNGGHLWIAGGPNNATWNGLTVGDHYARTWTDDVKGLEISGSTINTNGGHLYIAGYSWNSANTNGINYGVYIDFTNISTATGNIEIDGYLNGLYYVGAGTRIDAISGPISINTTSGNILIKGYGGDSNGSTGVGWRHALVLYSVNNTPPYALSIKSVSGNITINGTAVFSGSTVNDAEGITMGSTNASGLNVVSQTGSITLNGSNSRASTGQFCNGIRIYTGDVANAIVIGDDGINPYSGNITINADAILQRYNSTMSGTISVKTTGAVSIQPVSPSFSYLRAGSSPGILTFDNDWNFGTGITTLNFGKSGNGTDISLSNGVTTNGPINVYGGVMTIGGNLNPTNTSTGDILLQGKNVAGAGIINMPTGRTLTMNTWVDFTYPNAINGANVNFVKGWNGLAILSAACGYTGSTTVNSGILQFNESKTFGDITVAAGKTLILGPSKQFTINGACANDGTLKLSSGSTLLTGNSSLFSGAGSYVVEQYVTGAGTTTPTGRFWYLGSPISNAFSTAFNAGGPNVLKYRDEPNNQWVEITNDGVTLVPGRGYYCQVVANSTLSFAGSYYNNGPMTITNLSRTSGINFEGFNLVSNPYPSYLDWDAVTKTNVGNTMWYRTASGSTPASMVFDTYVAGSGGIGTNLNGAGVSNLIPPMQAFWVRVNQGQTSGSLTLDNSMRSHFTSINGSVAGLKSTSNDRALFLRMNLLNGTAKDQLIVYMNGAATNNFDALDGEKMMQAGIPQFYTKAADKKIVINGLNSAKKQQSLPITMEIPSTGVHTFEIENLELESGLVWLEDKQEETMQTLEEGFTYQFYAEAGINTERFVLHFNLLDNNTPSAPNFNEVGSAANFNGKGANVHAEAAGVVVIKLPASTEGSTDIQIRDAAGKLVYNGSTSNLQTSVQLAHANGIYYVTLSSNNGVEVRKVFVQQ